MRRLNQPGKRGTTFLLSLVFFATASTALSATIFSNTSSISIPATTGGVGLPATSDLYPSQITVSGMVGTLTDVSIVLDGWTDNGASANPGNLFFMVVAPNGQGYEFLGDVGSNHAITNVNLTLTDSASTSLTTGQITTGSFKPTLLGTSCPAFPSPAPAASCAPPQGTTTFFSKFFGSNPDGAWSLYIMDDTAGDTASTISGGWSLEIDSTGGFVPPPPGVPEPSSLVLLGLATSLLAFRKTISLRLHPAAPEQPIAS